MWYHLSEREKQLAMLIRLPSFFSSSLSFSLPRQTIDDNNKKRNVILRSANEEGEEEKKKKKKKEKVLYTEVLPSPAYSLYHAEIKKNREKSMVPLFSFFCT